MFDWLANLPVVWMGLVVLAGMGLLGTAIYLVVMRVADGDRGNALRALSPGMLPPMGILFALIVGFLAVGVWGNVDRAHEAVDTEASALRSVVLLSDSLPPAPRAHMRLLVRRQIRTAVHDEWPAMEQQRANLTAIPVPLSDALRLAVGLKPHDPGETVAQRELVSSVQDALDARRQRIIVSDASINAVKWVGRGGGIGRPGAVRDRCGSQRRPHERPRRHVHLQRCGGGRDHHAGAQNRPFSGQLGLSPSVLEQVLPRGR